MKHSTVTAMQRSKGSAALRFALRGGQTVLADLAQSGSARAMMPRTDAPHPEVVFLNTSGGLASGDRLSFALDLDPGTTITATTQTAERAYLARDSAAQVMVRMSVGAGGHLDWLPQETILFEDCHLNRDTRIDLGQGATCLLTEITVLGRRAMGEHPARPRLRDSRFVTLGGRPLWVENVSITAETMESATSPALLHGHVAFAVVALLGEGVETAAAALRALPVTNGVHMATSGWNGRTIVRLTAPDVWPLKQTLGRILTHLTRRPLPRVWQMQGITA